MSVSVSVVTYQSARHVDACLGAVRAQGPSVREILVADNGSSDGTPERVRARHPDATLLALGRNTGFAAAHNANWARARGRFLLVLNPDVVLRPGYVDALVARLEGDPAVGAATGRLLAAGAPLRVDSAGIAWDRGRTRFVDRGRGARPADYDRECDVLGACGAAALFRREALCAVSRPGEAPFAERLFMYYEDVDLAWRLRRQGWRIRYCPRAEAVHVRGGSGAAAAFVEYHLVRNRVWVSARNAGAGELLRELPGLALFLSAKALQSARRPHLRAALREGLAGWSACRAERRGTARLATPVTGGR